MTFLNDIKDFFWYTTDKCILETSLWISFKQSEQKERYWLHTLLMSYQPQVLVTFSTFLNFEDDSITLLLPSWKTVTTSSVQEYLLINALSL